MYEDWGSTRVPRVTRRPSPVFLAIVAVFVASGVLLWLEVGAVRLLVLLFVLAGWVVSLCLHEFAHAYTGFRAGDHGVEARGYLTLDPRRYTHPFLSIVIPLIFVLIGGFGLPGGAVWIDHAAIRNRVKETMISLAGPLTNVAFLLVALIPFWAGAGRGQGFFYVRPGSVTGGHLDFWGALAFLAFLQLIAGVLNLLPIPGLDGGNALQPWLNYEWRKAYATMAPYGLVVILLLLWSPTVNRVFFDTVYHVGNAIGLPTDLVSLGQLQFPSLRTGF